MKRIAIIGSGQLGQQISHHIQYDTKDKVIGYFDDFAEKGTLINGLPIIGKTTEVLNSFQKGIFDFLLIGIGYNHIESRKTFYNSFEFEIPFYTFIHSSCIIDPSAKIGKGTVIYPGCIIDKNTVIKDNVLINIGCSIAHDSIISSHSFLSPRVASAGFVNIDECCFIGINTTIIDNISITKSVQLGGGTVVIKNIEKPGLYVGNPTKFVRKL